ncbi:RCC1 domain-containing protein [Aureimonas phyllosphaerae]|uniref:RCC1 domain-containing protein n=1 Tax=Aureimonas phyllosphaerae TaxID=1166078 RepID=UPI003A5C0427
MTRHTSSILAAIALASTTGTALSADGYFFRARPATFGTATKPAPSLQLGQAVLPPARANQPWTYDFNSAATRANLGTESVTWSGRGLPSWMTISPATGVASGTPTATGGMSFEITASHPAVNARQTYRIEVAENVLEVTRIAVGQGQTCALVQDGAVKCWGQNNLGQLGVGNTVNTSSPGVAAVASGATAVSPGWFHTCALASGGAVRCWGNNQFGALGTGDTVNTSVAGVAAIASGAASVAAGSQHTCALLSGGAVKCWGRNDSGQLGIGDTTNTTVPGTAAIPSGATAVAAGASHTCALLSGGQVKCWGLDSFGQLGVGSTTNTTASGAAAIA